MKKILIIIILIIFEMGAIYGQKKSDISLYMGLGAGPKAHSIIYGDEIFTQQKGLSTAAFLGIKYSLQLTSKSLIGVKLENGTLAASYVQMEEPYINSCVDNNIISKGFKSSNSLFYIGKYSKYWALTPYYSYRQQFSERNIINYNVGFQFRHYISYSVSDIFSVYHDTVLNGVHVSYMEPLPVNGTSYTNSEYLNGQYDRSQFISLGFDLGLSYKRIIGKTKKHALSVGINLHYEPRYAIYSKYETTADSPVYSKGIFMMNGHNVNLQFGYHWLF